MEGVSWNYTTWLNIAFLLLAAALLLPLRPHRRRGHAPHDGRLPRRRGPPARWQR